MYIIEHKKPFMAYIKNQDTFVSSVKMFVNGKQVDPKIDKNDVGTRVSYLPDPFEPGEQVIKIVWLDNTGLSNTYEWKAKIPNFYFNHDRAPTNPAGYMNVFEYHNLQVLPQPIVLHTTNKYPDNPDENHKAFSIEWLPVAQRYLQFTSGKISRSLQAKWLVIFILQKLEIIHCCLVMMVIWLYR